MTTSNPAIYVVGKPENMNDLVKILHNYQKDDRHKVTFAITADTVPADRRVVRIDTSNQSPDAVFRITGILDEWGA